MMRNVVKEGTGTAAALEGVDVAGKTGTAEVNLQGLNNPWFIGFTDRFAVAVVLERVQGGTGGDGRRADRGQGPGVARRVRCRSIERDTMIDGRYRVLNRLGSGGMADVYCAEDTQLGRRVALKLLYRRFAEDAEFVERFRREASSAAGLQHPNIVGVFDRGEWDGTYYIAMEFLDGHTLKQLVREHGAMPPELASDITVQVLRAARFAHKRGVVHRDIKPHNVILDEEGRAKVTDFGIARAGASDMTETGSIMGTAQYLSPEQAQGQPVSPRSDLYSIGVMLYELLTGRVPFDAESPVTIALKHVTETPAPPSQRQPGGAAGAGRRGHARAGEGPGAPVRRRRRLHRGAPGGARAQPTVVALEQYPMPGEPFVALEEEDREARRWWLWLLILLALLALGIGAYLLLAPPKKPVPDVVGSRSAVASQRLQNAGFEVNIETVINRRRPHGPRRDPAAAARRGGEGGLDGDDHRLQRARPGHDPGRRRRAKAGGRAPSPAGGLPDRRARRRAPTRSGAAA